jgi:hypothetical protein
MTSYDFSDLGGTLASSPNNYDFSDLGGTPVGSATNNADPISAMMSPTGQSILNGMASGVVNTGIGALNLANKASGAINNFIAPGSVDTTPIPKVNSIGNAPIADPTAFQYGNYAGQVLPWFLTPEIGAAEKVAGLGESALGAAKPYVSDFLTKTFPGKVLSNSADMSLLGGATAPIYSDAPLSQSIPSGLLSGAVIGGAIPAGLGLLGGAGRLADVITANAEKAKLQEGSAYDAIKDEANTAGFRTNPQGYISTLTDQLNQIGQQSKFAVNKNLENDLYERLDEAQNANSKPGNIFSVDDTHAQLRQLNNEISSYARQGNYDAVRIYKNLKDSLYQDLTGSLTQQGLGNLADKFMQTQENYGQNVVPLRQFPTSWSDTAKQAAILAGLSHLPSSIGEYASVAAGAHHGALDPIFNIFRRFGSTYKGGPNAGLLAPQAALPYANAFALPLLAGGETQ